MSFRLQEVLQLNSKTAIRGHRTDQDNVLAMSGFIFSLIRNNRNQRRALLTSVLSMFDDSAVSSRAAYMYWFWYETYFINGTHLSL